MAISSGKEGVTVEGKKIDWPAIRLYVEGGHTIAEAAEKFEVRQGTIAKRAKRHNWIQPKHLRGAVEAELARAAERGVARATTDWLEKGEQHREIAFQVAHESVKKFQAKPPKSFRDLELADKIARRSAGLETADVNVATLIQLNERLENFEDEQPIEAIDAELIPDPETSALEGAEKEISSEPEGADGAAKAQPQIPAKSEGQSDDNALQS